MSTRNAPRARRAGEDKDTALLAETWGWSDADARLYLEAHANAALKEVQLTLQANAPRVKREQSLAHAPRRNAAEKPKKRAPLSERDRMRLDDLVALMKAATREYEMYTNPRAVFPDFSDQEVQWFKEWNPPQRQELENALLKWEERAGAVCNAIRGVGSRRTRLRPGAFAKLEASKRFDPSKDAFGHLRPRAVLGDDELIEHATTHAERLLSSDGAPSTLHLAALVRTVRTLYKRGIYGDRNVRFKAAQEITRDEAACMTLVKKALPAPARRGQRRGRKSAKAVVARLLGFDEKTVTAACSRAEKEGTTLQKRGLAQWAALQAETELKQPLSRDAEARALWTLFDPLADRY